MKDLRTLSHVPRWGVLRVIHRQSVADHSYYVTMYASLLAETEQLDDKDLAILLRYCLVHDLPEVFTSDIPGPIKRVSVDQDKMSSYEDKGMLERFGFKVEKPSQRLCTLAKIADLLDEICYCHSEMNMGNLEIRCAIDESKGRLRQMVDSCIPSLNQTTKRLIISIQECEFNTVSLPKDH